MKKVLITDKIHDTCISKLKSAGFQVDYRTMIKPEELQNSIGNYDVLVVRSATKVTKEIIDSGDKLEIIGRAGTGVDNIDVDSATKHGIIVMNTPGGNTISAAELAFAHIIALCRKLPQANRSMKHGKWDRKSFYGTELNGKTLGVIGLGQIGRVVALRANAFGMSVIAFDPVASKEWAAENNVKLIDQDTLFETSDIITLHVPLNDHTKDLINSSSIAKMKEGIKIVNCARGGIIDEDAILEALNSGKVSGLSLDVYKSEPPVFSDLITHPKVICTPHLGASTEDALEKVAEQISMQIIDFYSSGKLNGGINADILKYLSDADLLPYLNLAEKIGRLVSKFDCGDLSYSIELSGNLMHRNDEIINSAFQKGLLANRVDAVVNYINVATLSKEAGLSISTVKKFGEINYTNLIEIKFVINDQPRSFKGTVMTALPRIVGVDDYKIEFDLNGKLIFYKNNDKPGVLAFMCNKLAENQINIAGLALGRTDKGLKALTVISVDNEINEEILNESISNDDIEDIYYLEI